MEGGWRGLDRRTEHRIGKWLWKTRVSAAVATTARLVGWCIIRFSSLYDHLTWAIDYTPNLLLPLPKRQKREA